MKPREFEIVRVVWLPFSALDLVIRSNALDGMSRANSNASAEGLQF